jgi:predicted class III extradiol MEMO1 family dioxygenase
VRLWACLTVRRPRAAQKRDALCLLQTEVKVNWKAYYEGEWTAPGTAGRVAAWVAERADEALVDAVARGAILSFPHTALRYAGALQAAVLRALYGAGVRRIVALGVVHGVAFPAVRVAQDGAASPAERREAFDAASGGFLTLLRPADTPLGRAPLWTAPQEPGLVRRDADGMLRDEFSLDSFLALSAAFAARHGRGAIPVLPLYVGVTRDPETGAFDVAERLARWLRDVACSGTAIVATGDLVHCGDPYGSPLSAFGCHDADSAEPVLRCEVERALAAALRGDLDLAYRLSAERLRNDQREMLPVLAGLVGPGGSSRLLHFLLSDYAPILDVPPPCCVASALVRFDR